MNKATIMTDAVTYIEQLRRHVKDLSNQLLKMDTTFVKEEETTKIEEIDSAEEMTIWGIEVLRLLIINYEVFILE